MADEVSILAVASYHCIMSIVVISICIEPCRWESHITIPECSRARSVKKLYDYSGVLLWIMSPLAGRNRTGTASYVARGGVWCSFIPCWVWRQWTWICIALRSLRFIYIEVLCWHKWIWGSLFLFIWVLLFYSYVDIIYLLYIMFITCMKISMERYSNHEPLFSIWHVFFFI